MKQLIRVLILTLLIINSYFIFSKKSAALTETKTHVKKFGIVSFVRDNSDIWPLEWRMTPSPEDTQNNEFQILSPACNKRIC